MNKRYQTYCDLLQNINKACLVLDLELLDKNIQELVTVSKNKIIRLATKSIRSRKVIEYIQKQMKTPTGLMCYSLSEAIELRHKGFKNILMGYPTIDKAGLTEYLQDKNNNEVTFMVDRLEHLQMLNQMGLENHFTFKICIDIDLSLDLPGLHFGVWRSAITDEKQFIDLLKQIQKCPNVKLVGLMGYEAQVAGVNDNLPHQKLKSGVISVLKKISQKSVSEKRKRFVEIIQQYNFTLEFVNGGGTGSLAETTEEDWVTEVTIGSGFYSPALFDNYKNFKYHPSLFFALPITRNPHPNIYTCHGGGYIASGSTDTLKSPQPYLPEGFTLFDLEGAGEVQTPIHYKKQLKIGDKVFFRHAKAGEVCEHFNEIITIRNNKIENIIPTYRGENWCFL